MAQTRKDDVQRRIDEAALLVFSRGGFASATMAEIARQAGLSVGNIYRYYRSKDALFYAVLPPEFVERFRDLVGMKMKTADGIDLGVVKRHGPMGLRDESMKSFIFENRLQIVILLGRAAGTRYEGFRGELVDYTAKRAVEYLGTMHDGRPTDLDPVKRRLLGIVYDNLYRAVVGILAAFDESDAIAEAYDALFDYHYQGIAKFLG